MQNLSKILLAKNSKYVKLVMTIQKRLNLPLFSHLVQYLAILAVTECLIYFSNLKHFCISLAIP